MVHVMSEVKIVAWKGGPCINGSQDFAQAFARKYAAECLPLVLKSDFDAQRLRADTAESELKQMTEFRDNSAKKITRMRDEITAAEQRIEKLTGLIEEFCQRVEAGEVRSKATYAKFKAALNPNPEAGSHGRISD